MSRADNGNADFGRRGPELCEMGKGYMLFGPNGPRHEAHPPALGLVDMHLRQSLLPMSALGQKIWLRFRTG